MYVISLTSFNYDYINAAHNHKALIEAILQKLGVNWTAFLTPFQHFIHAEHSYQPQIWWIWRLMNISSFNPLRAELKHNTVSIQLPLHPLPQTFSIMYPLMIFTSWHNWQIAVKSRTETTTLEICLYLKYWVSYSIELTFIVKQGILLLRASRWRKVIPDSLFMLGKFIHPSSNRKIFRHRFACRWPWPNFGTVQCTLDN